MAGPDYQRRLPVVCGCFVADPVYQDQARVGLCGGRRLEERRRAAAVARHHHCVFLSRSPKVGGYPVWAGHEAVGVVTKMQRKAGTSFVVSNLEFRISPAVYSALQDGDSYQVYYTPYSKTLLSIEPALTAA